MDPNGLSAQELGAGEPVRLGSAGDIGLVVGSDQDIVYDLVLERYLQDQGIREGPYSNQDFRAKAATYPEVHNQLQFELSILDKLESATTLADFRSEAKTCSALNPVLWQIAM